MATYFSSFRSVYGGLINLMLISMPLACVNPDDLVLYGTVDVIVVDGLITNLSELQTIKLNRSRADRLTGRFGSLPITKATVDVLVDSAEVIPCHETVDGTYQLPADFKGQIGHAYQLRFTLPEGTRYASTQQVIQPVPAIDNVTAQFNPTSIYPPFTDNVYRAGHDFFIDFKDPAETRNYYRWDWKLWEKQEWCKTCYEGLYAVNVVTEIANGFYASGTDPFEDCLFPRTNSPAYQKIKDKRYDYNCRTQCWEIIYSHAITIFDDVYSNGGLLTGIKVAQIPFYDYNPALVEIRQSSMTADAYQYFKLFQQQTQNSGGIADTPPTALAGNVHNVANSSEKVVGYFTVSAIAPMRYWLDRKDTRGTAPGLFEALNGRHPSPEPPPPFGPDIILYGPPRPPTALCVPSETKTPYKPDGWRD